MMIRTVIIFVSIMILIFPNVYAQQSSDQCGISKFDCYQDLGFRLTSDPVICMDLPSDRNIVAKMRAYTEDAVMRWENQLNAGSASASPIWNIQLISSTTSDVCNISIQFIAKPTLDQQEIGPDVVGITDVYTDHTARIKIFYNALAVDGNGSYYFLDSLAPDNQMQWSIMHELGHAFGLDHYMMTDEEWKNWAEGETTSTSMPSVMVPYMPPSFVTSGSVITYYPTITQMDIRQLKSLYDNNGFGGQASQQFTYGIHNVPTPEMTSSDISYWAPLIREYFTNTTNNLASNDYGVHVLELVDVFDSERLVSIPDPVGNQTDITFWTYMPPWFTNDLSWWATSQISDKDLASAMQYLHNNGLFHFSQS